MSRWGKNIVVPLDSLLKEKENNNRPTVARSVGTVGKWGKMGFTSTRTYTLSALPAVVAAAAAAAAASPSQSPASILDDDMSVSVPEPPKPKKFFKSRNTAPPEVIAQIIQQLPRTSTSPNRETITSTSAGTYDGVTLVHNVRDPIKMKIPKSNSVERKKKSPKKPIKQSKTEQTQQQQHEQPNTETETYCVTMDVKPTKKKKEEKKLKPEAPPSRIISRARKAVNYCEDDEDERIPTPLKDMIFPKSKEPIPEKPPDMVEPVLPPPAAPAALVHVVTTPAQSPIAPKTPEHPPIVLRISKGTSRLVSTDSEEQPINSPQHETILKSRHTSIEDPNNNITNTPLQPSASCSVPLVTTPKIIVKPPKPSTSTATPTPSPTPIADSDTLKPTDCGVDETPEINYCTVQISPDKPPKERLKLIIKTDVIRNAIAVAAAAEKAKAAAAAERAVATAAVTATSTATSFDTSFDKREKEKKQKQKSKKHKHLKHANVEQLMTLAVQTAEFKTPSPHLALGSNNHPNHGNGSDSVQQIYARTIISPPALSERDFDSQSSVLGSISSKGNSTPQPLAQTVQEESRVIHSRSSSSVITSDLETSQHSSLVAPPSDIELRLESMMEGGGGGGGMLDAEDVSLNAAQKTAATAMTTQIPQLEPLQEDILAVLRGEETLSMEEATTAPTTTATTMPAALVVTLNGEPEMQEIDETDTFAISERPIRRGRRAVAAAKINYAEEESSPPPPKSQTSTTRTRGRKATAAASAALLMDEETAVQPAKRATRRAAVLATKKLDETINVDITPTPPLDIASLSTIKTNVANTVEEEEEQKKSTTNKLENQQPEESSVSIEQAPTPATATVPISALVIGTTVTAPATRRGRPRANNNNLNNNNNNNNIINKIVADLSAKAGAAEEAAKVTAAATLAPATVTASAATSNCNTRSYGRKRKNQQVTQVLQPPLTDDMLLESSSAAKIANYSCAANAGIASAVSTSTLTINVRSQENSIQSNQTPTMELESYSDVNMLASNMENNSNNASQSNFSPPLRDYKIKDKFKRTLMLDPQSSAQQASSSFNCSPTDGDVSPSNPMSNDVGMPANAAEETEQRAAVKLVISKKKGSIFKSRALIPDQAEQAAAKRSHLYKHRWNAEGNCGGANADDDVESVTIEGDNAKLMQTKRSVADAIFDDFSEDISGGTTSSCGNSPTLGKLTRVLKPNTMNNSNNNHYDAAALIGGGGTGAGGVGGDMITSVKVDRKAKEYYTVVRNVKTAHQIQEIGEYQEMHDDVEYILDALQSHNPTPTRCLSALQLATKCMTPAFRMHVRAHGVLTKFFKALSDANTDLSLGLCTTAIMYILSQEGLNMDLDRDSLELMINLLESEGIAAAPSDHATYERNKQKVRELCEEIKAQGKATHLNVDSITVGTLAMETLLSLTSKRAGEWFKEELRELGGLEHIIKTISECCRSALISDSGGGSNAPPINWTPSVLDNMKTVERCMRVLENVTQMNEENQKYMLTYADGSALNILCDLYNLCDRELILYPTNNCTAKDNHPGIVLRELLIPLMKVLINLTHTFDASNPRGAEFVGKRNDVFGISFHILLQVPNYIPDKCVFELNILVLLLLINLTMYTVSNRTAVMKAYAQQNCSNYYNSGEQNKVPAIQSVLEYFYKCEELAGMVEKNTDAILDCSEKNKKKQEEVDETVNNLLQKAGHHMEHTMKSSYAGILIGHIITDSEENERIVRTYLRGNGFKEIVSVLEKYYTFMNLTASSEASVVAHIKSTKKLIDYFIKRDLVYDMRDDNNDCVLPTTTATTTTTSDGLTDFTQHAIRNTQQRIYKTYSQR